MWLFISSPVRRLASDLQPILCSYQPGAGGISRTLLLFPFFPPLTLTVFCWIMLYLLPAALPPSTPQPLPTRPAPPTPRNSPQPPQLPFYLCPHKASSRRLNSSPGKSALMICVAFTCFLLLGLLGSSWRVHTLAAAKASSFRS